MSAFALTREEILGALADMNRRLEGQGIIGEICLFGGALMVLAFNARLSTKDVDALFQPSTEVRHAAAQVAAERGWPEAWLNDGVKGFISARHEITAGQLPQFSNLRLTMPTPEYLLAMKCVAARIGLGAGESDDTSDIRFLIRHLGLTTAGSVLDLVAAYFPADRIPAKTRFLVESLFEEGLS